MPPTMGAMIFRSHGGPDVLEWADVPRPVPQRDEALVRVAACGVNRLDLFTRAGHPSLKLRLPHILGCEPVGTVAALGPEVTTFAEGDRVMVAPGQLRDFHADRRRPYSAYPDYHVVGHGAPGGYGECVVARAENLVRIGERLSLEEWAAAPLVFLTAWHMLVGRARVRPGETVLVIAAGSGVGSAAIQIARHLGCRVIATAGSGAKLARAAEIGAHDGVSHADAGWPKEVRRLTGGRGVDVVVEHVGQAVFAQAVTTLAHGGRLVTCGVTTGTEARIDLSHLFVKQLSLLGSYMGDFHELVEVVALLDAGHVRPVVDRVFPVREAAAAHRRLESGEHFGKIVLTHG
jgi:NADPH:quinone reductase-like Zn-dependent oxidoreductase